MGKKRIFVSIISMISLILTFNYIIAQDRITGRNFATRSEIIAQNGMVATSHPLATQIGLEILQNGGNAIDAAIAANAALGLMEPTGCGIGGDLFAIIWNEKDKKLYGLNASGRSPAKLNLKYFKDRGMNKIPSYGPLPVTVPGCVDGWELPPNGQGIAVLQILNIMEGYNVKEMGFGSADYIHHFIEAKKLAFEDRAKYYADPAFNKIPVDRLISKEYSNERRKLIKDQAAKSYDAGKPDEDNTVYLTVADKYGNMVSLIQSNYRGMGSGMVPPKLGFMLQDRGELFSLEEGHFNLIEPGKRPFHTIIPAFITKDREPWVSFGLMGGAMQPQGHAQIVMNLVDFNMNLQEAGDAPRIQHTGSTEPTGDKMTDGGQVLLESGFDYETIRALMQKGHNVGFSLGSYGGYQAIMRDNKNGVYYGASESRKDGQAAGY